MEKYGRTRKEQKVDHARTYSIMETKVSQQAVDAFIVIGKNHLQHYLLRALFPHFTPYVQVSLHTAFHLYR